MQRWDAPGLLYHNQQKYELALADYTKAIDINPNHAEAYANRGGLYAILGQPEKVKIDLQQAAILFLQQNNMAAGSISLMQWVLILRAVKN